MTNFISRSDAKNEFQLWRKKLNDIQSKYSRSESFGTLFNSIKEKAGQGDAIMQDVLSYFYKSGVKGWLDEDYQKYIEWEFLAGANGNEFAIDKLQFFLSYAYDDIVANENFPKIKYYNDIDEFNYIYILGQKVCEEFVAKLNIDAQTLANKDDIYNPFSPEYFRDYRRAIDDVIPIVIEKMKSENNN